MIKTLGIISSIIPFGDTSLILKALSWDKGQISILAKGWRKKQEPVLRFCEYEFTLYEPKEEGLHLLKEASVLQDFTQYPSTEIWAAAEAGVELLSKIIIPSNESHDYYTVQREYLAYLQKTRINGILIFWRLFLRVFKLLGIESQLNTCRICGSKRALYAIDNVAGHICQECFGDLSESGQYTLLSQDATEILRLLPEIGMHLDRIKVSTVAVSELNRYFLQYYQVHQKQTLKLKSLSVLCQFYD